jgi:hypothetical protein
MSTLSSDDHLSPHNPLYYAPRRLRERSQRPLASFTETRSDRLKRLASTSTSQDALLEEAVAQALRRPLEPEVVPEPPEFTSGQDRQNSWLRIAGRSAAAIGVAAAAALVFVVLVPVSQEHARQADGSASSVSAILGAVQAAFNPPLQKGDDAMPDVSEFQTILASSRDEKPVTHEQSETLLQQFLQWQQKPPQTP